MINLIIKYPIQVLLFLLISMGFIVAVAQLIYLSLNIWVWKFVVKLGLNLEDKRIDDKLANKLRMMIYKFVFKKRNEKVLFKKVNAILSFVTCLVLFLNGITFTYNIIKIIPTILLSFINDRENIVTYLSLTATLTIVAYFPKNTGLWIYNMLDKWLNKFINNKDANIYNYFLTETDVIILFLRPKVLVYFISILFTVLNSLEKISGKDFITLHSWTSIKPTVIEAVFTVIVIDRFINQYKAEKRNSQQNQNNYRT